MPPSTRYTTACLLEGIRHVRLSLSELHIRLAYCVVNVCGKTFSQLSAFLRTARVRGQPLVHRHKHALATKIWQEIILY